MQDNYFTLIERLAPDLAQEIERRALVLERIGALQPVGRRQLAARLNLPERKSARWRRCSRSTGWSVWTPPE